MSSTFGNGKPRRSLATTKNLSNRYLNRRQAMLFGSAALVWGLESCTAKGAAPAVQSSGDSPQAKLDASTQSRSQLDSNSSSGVLSIHDDPAIGVSFPKGRTHKVKPGDNLSRRNFTNQMQPWDTFIFKAGAGYKRADIQNRLPVIYQAENWRPGMPESEMPLFEGIGGGKGVFFAEHGRDNEGSGLEAADAWTVLRGFKFKNLFSGGSNSNFSAFRVGKGNFLMEDCVVEGARQGVLAQLYSGSFKNPTREDGKDGKDIVIRRCKFLDCGFGGLSHGVYTRARHMYIDNCVFEFDANRANQKAAGHDIKHIGSILTVKNSIVGSENGSQSAAIDVSGYGGAVYIANTTVRLGRYASNRSLHVYRNARFGDNWAPEHFICRDNVYENWFDDAKRAIPRVSWGRVDPGSGLAQYFDVARCRFDNKSSISNFRAEMIPVWDSENTAVGKVTHV